MNFQEKDLKIEIDNYIEEDDRNPFKNTEPINISTIPAISSANLWARAEIDQSPCGNLQSPNGSTSHFNDTTGTFCKREDQNTFGNS